VFHALALSPKDLRRPSPEASFSAPSSLHPWGRAFQGSQPFHPAPDPTPASAALIFFLFRTKSFGESSRPEPLNLEKIPPETARERLPRCGLNWEEVNFDPPVDLLKTPIYIDRQSLS
jgi:hypothetical protein